jgi:hypothetical protein
MLSFRSLPALFTAAASVALAADPAPVATRATADYVPPELAQLTKPASSELRELVERFTADRDELERFYSVRTSALHLRRMREFYQAWQQRLGEVAFDSLGAEGRIDYTLLRTHLTYELHLLDRDESRAKEIAPLLPFAEEIAQLQESRRLMQPVEPKAAAATLDQMRKELEKARAGLEAGLKAQKVEKTKDEASKADESKVEAPKAEEAKSGADEAKPAPITPTRIAAYRAANRLAELRKSLDDWFKFYDGYDPLFSWWNRAPYKALNEGLDGYAKFLREKIVGVEPGKDEPIIGDPIGRDGLMAELDHEMIAYTPEQLIDIANREFAWCDAEWKRAAREMGFGDDWKGALEKVKHEYVEPGRQPELVRDLALEAIKFVSDRNLVTIPPLAADMWQQRMLSPAAQKVSPFFLGGENILIAFPTDAMEEDEKMQSLRANNVHFARATVFHELLPGHHLQYYYQERINQHRELFTTPFWVEGWALWWEFQMWDLGFPRSPEDRIGMLFWRTHRCARIIFSLNFHLGKWTPQQCIDFLVDRVGHERASATGEVRRSFNGDYSPLYQVGYMMGALQIRAMHKELVGPGKMTDRQFHDGIMMGGSMPIEMVRAHLEQAKLPKDFKPAWRFAD